MTVVRTQGVCARAIEFDVQEGIVKSVNFIGGCPGNLIGISTLVKDQPVEAVIEKLEGIRCGGKSTSCPDQFAQALKSFK
jgi:uncharacterized protein (TIGR03905 family)